MKNAPEVTLFWHRRDIRLEDNHGLFIAHQESAPVQPIFIFDTNILAPLPKSDARVSFIYHELKRLQKQLAKRGSSMDVRIGSPLEIWRKLVSDYVIRTVWCNRDYEPYAHERDKAVYELLKENGIEFKAKKDHVIFEKAEITKENGDPYVVYTPYSKRWKSKFSEKLVEHYKSENQNNWAQSNHPLPSLQEVGFVHTDISFPSRKVDAKVVSNYHETRDMPAKNGTTRVSLHLRFGTISIRMLVKKTKELNEKYLNELIWRDFYQSILWHFPEVVKENFNKKYNGVKWRNNEEEFDKWKKGKTGYPIVDAGMRELNKTGFMHNRVRMIVASFLTKHLLVDWRWGEAYFAEKLLDFELASNNGGWQWAAGTGVDAQPYFRIFNPYAQTDKFDKNHNYIKKWIPELETALYPKPIVDHKFARERCLEEYKIGMNSKLTPN